MYRMVQLLGPRLFVTGVLLRDHACLASLFQCYHMKAHDRDSQTNHQLLLDQKIVLSFLSIVEFLIVFTWPKLFLPVLA